MQFEKFQAAGNAYLVIEGQGADGGIAVADVQRICHADLGAGSDGILEILPSQRAHSYVRIYNPDGGQAEFSGNGSRIAVAYLCRRDGLGEVTIETVKGVVSGKVTGTSVTIDAGSAALEGADHAPGTGPAPAPAYTFVNVGNPHCVIRDDKVDELDLAAIGPPIEHHPWFPNRANVEFYRPTGPNSIRMRVWERGAGETLSSGSGSTAAAVAAVTGGDVQSPVTVQTDGGNLVIEISDQLDIRMTGPVEAVLTGTFDPQFTAHLEGGR